MARTTKMASRTSHPKTIVSVKFHQETFDYPTLSVYIHITGRKKHYPPAPVNAGKRKSVARDAESLDPE